jgi:hypothetical protein
VQGAAAADWFDIWQDVVVQQVTRLVSIDVAITVTVCIFPKSTRLLV